jgi:hypothetical protein
MHGPINVKSPNNISEWQMRFNSAFKELIVYFQTAVHHGCNFAGYCEINKFVSSNTKFRRQTKRILCAFDCSTSTRLPSGYRIVNILLQTWV